MDYDNEIDRALGQLPAWAPPPGFAEHLAAGLAATSDGLRPTRPFWMWTTAQAASVAVVAYTASVFVSRVATSLTLTGMSTFEKYARSLFSL